MSEAGLLNLFTSLWVGCRGRRYLLAHPWPPLSLFAGQVIVELALHFQEYKWLLMTSNCNDLNSFSSHSQRGSVTSVPEFWNFENVIPATALLSAGHRACSVAFKGWGVSCGSSCLVWCMSLSHNLSASLLRLMNVLSLVNWIKLVTLRRDVGCGWQKRKATWIFCKPYVNTVLLVNTSTRCLKRKDNTHVPGFLHSVVSSMNVSTSQPQPSHWSSPR